MEKRSYKKRDWQLLIYSLIGYLLGNSDVIDLYPILNSASKAVL